MQKRGVQLSTATEKSEAEDKDKESRDNREDKSTDNKKEEVEVIIKPTGKEVLASNAERLKSFDRQNDECIQFTNRKYACHICRSNGKSKGYWGFSLLSALKKHSESTNHPPFEGDVDEYSYYVCDLTECDELSLTYEEHLAHQIDHLDFLCVFVVNLTLT